MDNRTEVRDFLISRRAQPSPQQAGTLPRRRSGSRGTVPTSRQWVLDRFTAPAIVRNARRDLLASCSAEPITDTTASEKVRP